MCSECVRASPAGDIPFLSHSTSKLLLCDRCATEVQMRHRVFLLVAKSLRVWNKHEKKLAGWLLLSVVSILQPCLSECRCTKQASSDLPVLQHLSFCLHCQKKVCGMFLFFPFFFFLFLSPIFPTTKVVGCFPFYFLSFFFFNLLLLQHLVYCAVIQITL